MADSPDFVVFGESNSPVVRHEIPVALGVPAAYIEHDGRSVIITHAISVPTAQALDVGEVLSFEDFGLERLLTEGSTLSAAIAESVASGLASIGVKKALAPDDFPLGLAEVLRSAGVELQVDQVFFDDRRRSKTPDELIGITRGQRAAEAAMAAVRAEIREGIETDELRRIAWRTLAEHGAAPPDVLILACGPQGAKVYDEGTGPIRPHEPICIDIFPRDIASGCWGDLTRTFCLGEPPERLRQCYEDVLEATRLTVEAVKPGITGEELNLIAARYLQDRGHPTRLDWPTGTYLEEGFTHQVGHGVGLDLHEEPALDEGAGPVVVGDVLAIEPAVYYADLGGIRVEDVVLVTENGYEMITDCPYELEIL